MTSNQIAMLRYLEDSRHNQEAELESKRSNKAREAENYRSNMMNERLQALSIREQSRHNVASESLGLLQTKESIRSNQAREYETHRSNVAKETEVNRHNEVMEGIEGQKLPYQLNLMDAQTAQTHTSGVGNVVNAVKGIVETALRFVG